MPPSGWRRSRMSTQKSSFTRARPAVSCAASAELLPADPGSLIDLLHRLSLLAQDLPEVAELDLNPVYRAPDGCVAVDARVRIRGPRRPPTPKSW